MRGGTYFGKFVCSLNGITLRSYPGEWAVIDGYVHTTTSQSINNTSDPVSFTVANAAVLDIGVFLTIDDETLYITNIVSSTVTANRANNGTAIATHSSGALAVVGGFTFLLDGSNGTYRDFEVTTSDPRRVVPVDFPTAPDFQEMGLRLNGPSNNLINLVMHDTAGGNFFGTPNAIGSTIYGCVIYNAGNQRGTTFAGHGLYVQSNAASLNVTDNIVFNNFDTGIKAVSQNGNSIGFRINGNVAFNNGSQNPSNTTARGPGIEVGANNGISDDNVISGNYTYLPNNTSSSCIRMGYTGSNGSGSLINNYIMGGSPALTVNQWATLVVTGNKMRLQATVPAGPNKEVVSYELLGGATVTWDSNLYYNLNAVTNPFGRAGIADVTFANWKAQTGFDTNSTYSTSNPLNEVIIRPNTMMDSQSRMVATVVVYNWTHANSVNVNLSTSGLVNGQQYKLINAADYVNSVANPVQSGTYNSGSPTISVDFTAATATSVATPTGMSYTPTTTMPEFGVFVVLLSPVTPQTIPLTFSATSRQVAINYNAPNFSPCAVEVSESPTYGPLVNDVNSTLYTGANLDNRSGALGTGATARQFIAGTIQQPNGVTPLIALDGKIYPRVLQVNTTHYVRVTCGTSVGTGSVATRNIPLGKTWDEPMPITAAGVYGFPTLDAANRDETVLDPQLGTLLRKVSITGDNAWNGPADMVEFTENGAQWPDAQATINNSSAVPGYLKQVLTLQAFTRLYWSNAAGVSKFLGHLVLPVSASGYMFARYVHTTSSLTGTDPRKIFNIFLDDSNNAHIWQCLLPAAGVYYDTSVGPVTTTCTWSDLGDLSAKMLAFDATYDKTKFANFFYQNVQGDFLNFTAARGQQNSYAWIGQYQISTGNVVGLFPQWVRSGNGTTTNQRFCGYHTSQPNLGTNQVSWESHDLVDSSGVGEGPYTTPLNGAMNNSQTTITLTSNTPSAPAADTTLYAFGAGDEIRVDGEIMYLTSFSAGTTWNISRGQAGTVAAAHSNGVDVRAGCRCHDPSDYTAAAIAWWNPTTDPTGTSVNMINDGVNGHQGWANLFKIGSGWKGGPAAVNTAISAFTFSNSPAFNSVTKNYGGNAGMMHAAPVHQSNAAPSEKTTGFDFIHPYGDPDAIPTSVTNIAGDVFKVALPVTLDVKSLPIVAFAGLHKLLDISSPTSAIASAVDYTYCFAYKAGECSLGSLINSLYVKAPNVTTSSTCPTYIDPSDTTNSGICVFNGPGSGTQNMVEIGLIEAYSNGKLLRALTQGLAPYKQINTFENAQVSPDGNWVSFLVWGSDGKQNVWQVKRPPWPGFDGISRNTFQIRTVAVTGPSNTATAITEFGYNTSFNCTSRNEPCALATSNSPYFFETADTYTRLSCPSGVCSFSIPVVPDHVVYARTKYYDAGGSLIATGATFALTDNGAVPPPPAVSVCNWSTSPACQ